jgi:hypothetical protein
MTDEERTMSGERVRALAEAVDLPLRPEQIAPLARAFDDAMAMVRDLETIAKPAGVTLIEKYDAAWPEGGR